MFYVKCIKKAYQDGGQPLSKPSLLTTNIIALMLFLLKAYVPSPNPVTEGLCQRAINVSAQIEIQSYRKYMFDLFDVNSGEMCDNKT